MAKNGRVCLAGVLLTALCTACGCQLNNRTQEIRSEEQRLPVTFENARAEELFIKAVKTTYGQEKNVKRIGFPSLSLYSRNETVAWNANCNDHLRKLDKDGNLFITQPEAQSYYNSITPAESQAGGSDRR